MPYGSQVTVKFNVDISKAVEGFAHVGEALRELTKGVQRVAETFSEWPGLKIPERRSSSRYTRRHSHLTRADKLARRARRRHLHAYTRSARRGWH